MLVPDRFGFFLWSVVASRPWWLANRFSYLYIFSHLLGNWTDPISKTILLSSEKALRSSSNHHAKANWLIITMNMSLICISPLIAGLLGSLQRIVSTRMIIYNALASMCLHTVDINFGSIRASYLQTVFYLPSSMDLVTSAKHRLITGAGWYWVAQKLHFVNYPTLMYIYLRVVFFFAQLDNLLGFCAIHHLHRSEVMIDICNIRYY